MNDPNCPIEEKFFHGVAVPLDAKLEYIIGCPEYWAGSEKQLRDIMEGKFQKIEDIRKEWAEYKPPPADPIKEEDKKSKKEKKPKGKEEEEGEVLQKPPKPEKAGKGIVAVQIEKAPAKLRPQTGTVIGLPKTKKKDVWRW